LGRSRKIDAWSDATVIRWEGLSLVNRLSQAVLRHSVFLRHLIAQDVDEHDREWFAGCKLHHLEGLPGRAYEVLRALVIVWASGIGDARFLAANAVATMALIAVQALLRNTRATMVDLVEYWRWYMVWRGVMLAVLAGLTIHLVPDARLAPVLMAITLAYGVEAFAQFPLPVTALVTHLFGIAAITLGLIGRHDAVPGVLLVLMVLAAMSAHLRIFNFYYLFATRRLRTRKLGAANETIQLLLNQYDEHGSDCLVETDANGVVRKASERLCRMAGRTASQINGVKLIDLYDDGPEREAIERTARQLKPFRELVAPVTTAQGQRWWLLSGCAVFDSNGQHCGFRGFIRDVTDRHHAERRVQFLANHDALTQLPNRTEFHARLDAATGRLSTRRASGDAIAFAVLFIDLDRFKLINDSSGHLAGDAVLVETARRLSGLIGPRDLVARLGGDEFAALIDAPVSREAVIATGEALIAALSAPIRYGMRALDVGASVGIALAGLHGTSGDDLLRAADLALYEAKMNGRGRVAVYSIDLLRGQVDRQTMEIALRAALSNGEFELFYQPFVDLASRAIVGFEALLRWNHPQRGLVEPGLFIPLAEESGLIVPIGEWVLREALAEAATWPADISIAVNVSALQLRGGEILRQVIAALSSSGFDPARLELEITETVLIDNEAQTLRVLHRLRSLGVRIALDDFGTGYSSLNYLRSFPFDKIKIDRCFVSDLSDRAGDSGDSPAIVEAVLDLAGKLNMATIAEGVEDESQLERLREKGCQQVQGYLTGRAMPAADLPITRIAAKHAAPEPVMPVAHRCDEDCAGGNCLRCWQEQAAG
jgi:diguanylate cyclase (GGDEF)-like protein/PAS domain S-box-containing protein